MSWQAPTERNRLTESYEISRSWVCSRGPVVGKEHGDLILRLREQRQHLRAGFGWSSQTSPTSMDVDAQLMQPREQQQEEHNHHQQQVYTNANNANKTHREVFVIIRRHGSPQRARLMEELEGPVSKDRKERHGLSRECSGNAKQRQCLTPVSGRRTRSSGRSRLRAPRKSNAQSVNPSCSMPFCHSAISIRVHIALI